VYICGVTLLLVKTLTDTYICGITLLLVKRFLTGPRRLMCVSLWNTVNLLRGVL